MDANSPDLAGYTNRLTHSMSAPLSFVPVCESPTAIQVERAVIFPMLMAPTPVDQTAIERLLHTPGFSRLTIVDRAAHHRPAYRGLLVYAWLQAARLAPAALKQRWSQALREAADFLESQIKHVGLPPENLTADRGAMLTGLIWDALAVFTAGQLFSRSTALKHARRFFHTLVDHQQPSGAFLSATASDNPETLGYHELVLLHALTTYAVAAPDRSAMQACARSAAFHQEQTQPDHSTSHPWGLLAFIVSPATHPTADQMLHAALTQSPGGVQGLPLVLLADALYGLRIMMESKSSNQVDPDLLEILRCPLSKSRLRQQGDWLVAEVGGLSYPVREGIPVMLVEDAKLPAGVSSLEELRAKLGR